MGGRHHTIPDPTLDDMNQSARKYGFRDMDDVEQTFNLGKPGNPNSVFGHYYRCLDTMEKIKKLNDEWQQTPQGTHNWRDTLTFNMVDGRTRRDICRDNLNNYLDEVQRDWGLNDAQMRKICQKAGVPANERGRVAMSTNVDENPIKTNVRPTIAFNSAPANTLTQVVVPQPVMRVVASGPAPGVAA